MTRIKSDFLSVLSAAKFLLSDLRGLRSDCLPLAVASTIDIEKTILAAYINRLFGSRVFVLSVPNNAAPGDESRVSINDSHLRINHLKRIRGDASRFNSLYFIGLSRQRSVRINNHRIICYDAPRRFSIVTLIRVGPFTFELQYFRLNRSRIKRLF